VNGQKRIKVAHNKKNDKYLKIISEAYGGEVEEINKIILNVSIDKQKCLNKYRILKPEYIFYQSA
jgi:hypothetical protein